MPSLNSAVFEVFGCELRATFLSYKADEDEEEEEEEEEEDEEGKDERAASMCGYTDTPTN